MPTLGLLDSLKSNPARQALMVLETPDLLGRLRTCLADIICNEFGSKIHFQSNSFVVAALTHDIGDFGARDSTA